METIYVLFHRGIMYGAYPCHEDALSAADKFCFMFGEFEIRMTFYKRYIVPTEEFFGNANPKSV